MHQQRQRLLLVDGDVRRAERLAHRLSHLEFETQIAANGAEALLKIHELRPDVVVAAAETPILSGYLLVEAIRNEPRTAGIPVILLTEATGQEELARGWRAGADLCVPRGTGEADVLATLHRALSNVRYDRAAGRLMLVP